MISFDDTGSPQRTEVFIGEEAATKVCTQVISESMFKVDSCLDSNAPSVTIEFYMKAIEDAIARSVVFRIVTEILPSNLSFSKKMMRVGIELRHLDKVKGNFGVFDNKVYLATAIIRESQPISQVIHSNISAIVEQQQYLFETLWDKAVPADERIREIEEGIPTQRTEVLHKPENMTKAVAEFFSGAFTALDICADHTWPSVAMELDVFKQAFVDVNKNKAKSRVVTEITKDNIRYCKELMNLGELRHLDGIKGNFAVSERVYIAYTTMQESCLSQQVIRSNVKEIVEQQKYVFENFWNRATAAQIRIRDIEEGISLGVTEVIQLPSKIQELFINLAMSAKEEVSLVLPTINAFYRDERLGIFRLLRDAALDRKINVRILTPTNDVIEKMIASITAVLDQGQKLNIQPMKTFTGTAITTVTIMIVDRKEILTIEKIDDTQVNFLEAIGTATYSNSKPTVSSYVSIFESLWQQTRLYTHIREVNEQLLATEKAKEEFISMVSHELKTPLVPLKGYAQMLLRPKIMGGAQVNERQKNAINAMNRNIEKLQALVEDVMDVYKLDMGKLRFSRSDTSITELIHETVSELRPLTLNKKIDLDANIQLNGTVFCDPNRIGQVLSNLIKNSIDFVPDTDGKIIVRVQKEDYNNNDDDFKMALFTVEDNGIGINPEKADKLFQKFYQIDTGPTRKHAGTGLGLVICRGIIEAHGGKIWVDNTRRIGAAIKFTLPVRGQEDQGERDTRI
jgi:two-component system sensor histidine kinase VicK